MTIDIDTYHQIHRISEEMRYRANQAGIPMDKVESLRRTTALMGIPENQADIRTLRKSAVVSVAVVVLGGMAVIAAALSVSSPLRLLMWAFFAATLSMPPAMSVIICRNVGVHPLICGVAAAAILILEVAFMWMFSVISS